MADLKFTSEGIEMMKKLTLACLLSLAGADVNAQLAEQGLQGSWKFLQSFTYVHVDEQDRVFQCRIDSDMNVRFATSVYQAGGAIEWSPVRFFSLYGREVVPSGTEWGMNTMELRTRIMFLDGTSTDAQSLDRMEFDKVATLPTLCEHYRQIAFE